MQRKAAAGPAALMPSTFCLDLLAQLPLLTPWWKRPVDPYLAGGEDDSVQCPCLETEESFCTVAWSSGYHWLIFTDTRAEFHSWNIYIFNKTFRNHSACQEYICGLRNKNKEAVSLAGYKLIFSGTHERQQCFVKDQGEASGAAPAEPQGADMFTLYRGNSSHLQCQGAEPQQKGKATAPLPAQQELCKSIIPSIHRVWGLVTASASASSLLVNETRRLK